MVIREKNLYSMFAFYVLISEISSLNEFFAVVALSKRGEGKRKRRGRFRSSSSSSPFSHLLPFLFLLLR